MLIHSFCSIVSERGRMRTDPAESSLLGLEALAYVSCRYGQCHGVGEEPRAGS